MTKIGYPGLEIHAGVHKQLLDQVGRGGLTARDYKNGSS